MNEVARNDQLKPRWGMFSDDLENMFEGIFRPLSRMSGVNEGSLIPVVNVVDEESRYVVTAELPGVNKKDIDVSVSDGVLTIQAERKMEEKKTEEDGKVIRQESQYGHYRRTMRLDGTIDVEKIKAEYKDGVLNLDLPKIKTPEPAKIDIDIS